MVWLRFHELERIWFCMCEKRCRPSCDTSQGQSAAEERKQRLSEIRCVQWRWDAGSAEVFSICQCQDTHSNHMFLLKFEKHKSYCMLEANLTNHSFTFTLPVQFVSSEPQKSEEDDDRLVLININWQLLTPFCVALLLIFLFCATKFLLDKL